jgi:hypothetical protein
MRVSLKQPRLNAPSAEGGQHRKAFGDCDGLTAGPPWPPQRPPRGSAERYGRPGDASAPRFAAPSSKTAAGASQRSACAITWPSPRTCQHPQGASRNPSQPRSRRRPGRLRPTQHQSRSATFCCPPERSRLPRLIPTRLTLLPYSDRHEDTRRGDGCCGGDAAARWLWWG